VSGDQIGTAAHHIHLFASADRVPVGHLFTVTWRTFCSGAAVAHSQLSTTAENGLTAIEAVADHGLRQMIHTRPDVIIFTLAVTFEDGVKRRARAKVRVSD
jgi:hypothetical protein